MADLRYAGQSSVLTLVRGSEDWRLAKEHLEDTFAEEHQRTYGRRLLREPVELVGLRVVATARSNAAPATAVPYVAANVRGGDRKVYWSPKSGYMAAPVIQRHSLSSDWLKGPLIIEEYDATTVVGPDDRVRVQEGNVVIDVAI